MNLAFDTPASYLREHYRICISVEQEKTSSGNIKYHFSSADRKGARTLSLWCMNPGTAMSSVTSKGARSVILTSGTLSPLAGTERELGIPFPIKLENEHVISAEQVWMATIKCGPRNIKFDSSYRNRDSVDYVVDLGSAILNFAQVVPDGMLVFFPSYFLMGKALAVWKNPGVGGSGSLYERLERKKPIVLEPRESNMFQAALEQHQRNVKTRGGGILLAVCRGKTSEGLDFSDDLARAVILAGIPFPMLKDPKVCLKREYLSKRHRNGGNEWYTQSAFKAVNQAIGRVIRHRYDFGAVILCDARFDGSETTPRFSAWLRPFVMSFASFGAAQSSLAKFFREISSAPVILQRKRELNALEVEAALKMRKICKVNSAVESILPQVSRPAGRNEVGESSNRAPPTREEVASKLLPKIRNQLGPKQYRNFIALLKDAKSISEKRMKGDENVRKDIRKCFRQLYQLLSGSEAGSLALREISQFVPANLKDDYRRYVIGFLLSGNSTKSEGIVGLLKSTRLSIGEEEYGRLRRHLGRLKQLEDGVKRDTVRDLFQNVCAIFVQNVPDDQSPSAEELLSTWRNYMPNEWKELYDQVVAECVPSALSVPTVT
mmetsp:Transcript_10335/g.31603  ORF Transcript_10335/g.31603 Transcript_10335/m.31603 type:complete len:605 (-) Transcript_10335:2225-4039(-)